MFRWNEKLINMGWWENQERIPVFLLGGVTIVIDTTFSYRKERTRWKWNIPSLLQIANSNAVTDLGCAKDTPSRSGSRISKPPPVAEKLHGNEKIWTERGCASPAPPWIRQLMPPFMFSSFSYNLRSATAMSVVANLFDFGKMRMQLERQKPKITFFGNCLN